MFKHVIKVITSSSFLDEKYHYSWSKTDFKPTSSLFFKCVICIMLNTVDMMINIWSYSCTQFIFNNRFLLQRWCYCQKRSTGNKTTNTLNFVAWLLQDSQNLNINENTYDKTNITKHTHMKMYQIRFIRDAQF